MKEMEREKVSEREREWEVSRTETLGLSPNAPGEKSVGHLAAG